MSFYVFKVLITALIILVITETAKFNLKIAALLTAMPIITLLCIFWMYYEGASPEKISKHMTYTVFFVVPTLPMFLVFPYVIAKFGFYVAVSISLVLTALCIYLFNMLSEHAGFKIL